MTLQDFKLKMISDLSSIYEMDELNSIFNLLSEDYLKIPRSKILLADEIDLDESNQKQILDEIAYYNPEDNMNDLPEPVQWFNLVRNLTMTGYFTSEVGIKELGYKGNMPNVWDGVPQDVLDQYGLKYDEDWLEKCIDQSTRMTIAEWDDEGNLLT